MHPKVYKDKIHGGWWFKYFHPKDREWTENGPFSTYDEAESRLHEELENLNIEMEGAL